jgi:hypothetical protein
MLPCNANHELARDAPNTIPVECPDPCAAPVDPYRVAIADPMEGLSVLGLANILTENR